MIFSFRYTQSHTQKSPLKSQKTDPPSLKTHLTVWTISRDFWFCYLTGLKLKYFQWINYQCWWSCSTINPKLSSAAVDPSWYHLWVHYHEDLNFPNLVAVVLIRQSKKIELMLVHFYQVFIIRLDNINFKGVPIKSRNRVKGPVG